MEKQDIKKPNLPRLRVPVDKMDRKDLQIHLSRIVRSTHELSGSNKERKPKWWLSSVPWSSHRMNARDQVTETLRRLIRNCYKYYGVENMLKGNLYRPDGHGDVKSPRKSLKNGRWVANSDPAIAADAPVSVSGRIPKDVLVRLQEIVVPAVTPVRQKKASPKAIIPSGPKGYNNRLRNKLMSFVEIFVCYHCEKEFGGRKSLKDHQEICSMKPRHMDQTDSPVLTRLGPLRPPPIRRPLWCTNHIHPDDQVRAQKNPFVEYLDLLPANKVDVVSNKRKAMVDCDELDLEDGPMPMSPTTPRTKMTLLRQDSSPPVNIKAKRSLSGDLSESSYSMEKKADGNADSDAESENSNTAKSDSSEDSTKLKRSATTRLLSIPITSELGHRVQKHIEARKELLSKELNNEGDKELHITSNYEKYCHTPRKSEHYGRLRTRAEVEYPVTFNKRRELSDFRCHKYKFTQKQHVEFWKTVKTGLNARARRLRLKTRKCTVPLKKLTEEDFKMWLVDYQQPTVIMKALSTAVIKKWSKKHQRDSYMIPMILDSPQFPKSPEHISDADLKRLLGLRNQNDVPFRKRSLSLSQCVSEDVNAEVTQQRAVVYKTLLKAMDKTSGESALTPPDTPPEQDTGAVDDVELFETLDVNQKHTDADNCSAVKKLLTAPNQHRSHILEMEPITKMGPMVFSSRSKQPDSYRQSSVNKWETRGGVLVPLVQSTTVDDFVVTLNDNNSSSKNSPSPGRKLRSPKRRKIVTLNPVEPCPRKNSISSASSDTSESAIRENLPPKKVIPVKKKKAKKTYISQKAASKSMPKGKTVKASSLKSKLKFTGKNSTNLSLVSRKVPAKKSTSKKRQAKPANNRQRKRKAARKSKVTDSDEDNEVILSDRSSLASDTPTKTDIGMLDVKPGVVKRKRVCKSGKTTMPSKKAKAKTSVKKKTDDSRSIMFKCHLCGVELQATLGERDFISEHYQEAHDVHNIRLRENVNNDGLRTVSVIRDVSKTPRGNESKKGKKIKSPIKPQKAVNRSTTPKKRGRPCKVGQTVKMVA